MQRKLQRFANACQRERLDSTIIAQLPTLEQVRDGAVAQESREQALARTLSQSGRGAQAWVKAYIWNGMEINSLHTQLAVRRGLGIWTTFAPSSCPYHGSREAAHANDRINATHHAITCPNTGLASTSHHDVAANGVVMALHSAGVPPSAVRREQMSCFDGPGAMSARAAAIKSNKTFRMDLVLDASALARARSVEFRNKNILIDVTVTNPAAVSHITARSDRTAGVAAADGEQKKRTKYIVTHGPTFSAATSTLVPFAMETYGRLGDDAHKFVAALVEHGSRVTGQAPSALTTKIYQRLSVALQRAVSRRECAYIEKLRVTVALCRTPLAPQNCCGMCSLAALAHPPGLSRRLST
jgi:hypothetical protein